MEETKLKDPDKKNNGRNQTRNTVSLWICMDLGLLFLLKIRGHGFVAVGRFFWDGGGGGVGPSLLLYQAIKKNLQYIHEYKFSFFFMSKKKFIVREKGHNAWEVYKRYTKESRISFFFFFLKKEKFR